MSKYSLSYIENDIIKLVDLSSYEELLNYDLNDIKTIDFFTTKFNNEEELLNSLKTKDLIGENVDKLYVYSEKREEGKIIFDGDILLFSKDKNHFNMSYINYVFEMYKNDPKKMLLLARLYAKKYSKSEGMLNKVNNLFNYANSKIDGWYEASSYSERNYMDEAVKYFIKSEFFSKNSNNVYKEKYTSLRDFLIKKMYVDGKLDINRRHSYLSYNYKIEEKSNIKRKVVKINDIDTDYDYEEFLFEEDIKRSNNEILKNFKSEKEEPILDGNDYIVPLTYKELKKSLEESGRKLILKPGDGGKV